MIKNIKSKVIIHCNLIAIYKATAYNAKAVVILHAPKSCSHIPYDSVWKNQARLRNLYGNKLPVLASGNLLVTGIGEKEVIFGGETRLRQCLLYAAAHKEPEYMIVAVGCAAGIIGDDVTAVCKEVERQTGIPIIVMPGAGFMNKQTEDGMLLTTKLLIKKFVDRSKRHPLPDTAVVFGINALVGKFMGIGEIKKLLAYFGITRVFFPPVFMTKKDFEDLGTVSLVLPTGVISSKFKEVKKFAYEFAGQMGIACTSSDFPQTSVATLAYIKMLGEILHKKELAASALKKEKQKLVQAQISCSQVLGGKCYLFAIGTGTSSLRPADIITSLDEVGLQVRGFILLESLSEKDVRTYKKILESYGIPIYSQAEYLDKKTASDFIVTTVPQRFFDCQYCVKFRRIGIDGVIALWSGAVKLLSDRQRSIVYE